MRLNFKLYFKTLYYSFFKSRGIPGRLTIKRFLILCFIFTLYPFWHLSLRIAYFLDNLLYPDYVDQNIQQQIFIIGNFRSGTTLLHRLLTLNKDYTCLTSWEIYLAPSIVERKILRWGMRINRIIGNPIRKLADSFEKALSSYSYMHKTGLQEVEEGAQVLFHTWSTYDLLAFFPFPKLVRDYIYYDDKIPKKVKQQDMAYYDDIIRKHVYTSEGDFYVAKNPTYSPKVKTLHQKYPDAKFINIVRNPLQTIPSSISMFSNHWHTYGAPEEQYSLQETIIEHAKHWYIYPHTTLKNLPESQYIMIKYSDLIADPKGTIKQIYKQFGLEISAEYEKILSRESEKAKRFSSNHKYSLREMGLTPIKIYKEFGTVLRKYGINPHES